MTFLEYVCQREMGPPAFRSGGRSTWRCPFHAPDNHPSFSTLPHKPGMKDRFKCFGCQAWGDEHDLLKGLGVRDYGDRLCKLNEYRQDFERHDPQSNRFLPSPRGEGSKHIYNYN